MVKKLITYSLFCAVPVLNILSGCGHDVSQDYQSNNNGFEYSTNMSPLNNEVFYKNNLITIEEIENKYFENQSFSIQCIEKDAGDLTFRMKKIPTELYLQNQGLSEDELHEALQEVQGEQLFYFEIEEKQKQDVVKKYLEKDFDKNISYLSFDIYRDFALVNGQGDTIQASYSLYERTYHVAPFERVILTFDGVDGTDEFQLIYHDHLFGKGESNFNFAPEKKISQNTIQPS